MEVELLSWSVTFNPNISDVSRIRYEKAYDHSVGFSILGVNISDGGQYMCQSKDGLSTINQNMTFHVYGM